MEESNSEHLDQPGGNQDFIDLTKDKVNDVDARDDDDDPNTVMLQNLTAVYKKWFFVKQELIDFLMVCTKANLDDTTEISLETYMKGEKKYIDHFGPFTITSFYYVQSMAYSLLVQALTKRTIPNTIVTGCIFCMWTLRFQLCFQVCHIAQSVAHKKLEGKILSKEKKMF